MPGSVGHPCPYFFSQYLNLVIWEGRPKLFLLFCNVSRALSCWRVNSVVDHSSERKISERKSSEGLVKRAKVKRAKGNRAKNWVLERSLIDFLIIINLPNWQLFIVCLVHKHLISVQRGKNNLEITQIKLFKLFINNNLINISV